MNQKTSLQKSLFPRFSLRAISLFTVIAFLGTSFSSPATAQTPISSNVQGGTDTRLLASASASSGKVQEIVIPPEIGTITEAYGIRRNDYSVRRTQDPVPGTPYALRPTVVLIQDAHAVPDAQRSLEKLIEYLQKEYGVTTVAVEGAEGKIDPTLFPSVPGCPEAAAEFSGNTSQAANFPVLLRRAFFRKVKRNLSGSKTGSFTKRAWRHFLPVLGNRPISNLKSQNSKLNFKKSKQNIIPKKRRSSIKNLRSVNAEPEKLNDFLSALAKYYVLITNDEAHGTSYIVLSSLFRALAQEKRSDPKLEAEVKKLAQYVHKNAPSAQLNSLAQDYRTERLSLAAFAYELRKLLPSVIPAQAGIQSGSPIKAFGDDKSMRLSLELQALIANHEKLTGLKGSELVKELEAFVSDVKARVFETPEAKAVAELDERLHLFGEIDQF